jgi:DNA replication and repair protein RecF
MTVAGLKISGHTAPVTSTGGSGETGGDAVASALAIERLTLNDYRNYQHLRFDPEPTAVVLTGVNGAGKTNLLEALSFLAPGRGLRNTRLGDITRVDAGEAAQWAVSARLTGPNGVFEIGTGSDPENSGDRRVVRVDGATVRGQAPLAECLGVLWLTPTMDRLFIEGPSARRRFLDRLVTGLEPGHARQLSAFERSLRERARLLSERADNAWISAVEETLAAHAVAVAAARREAVARLSAALDRDQGPFPRASLAIAGEIEGWLDEMAAVDVEHRLCQALRASRGHDADSGGASHGPHRSDLEVTNLDKSMPARQCSTGEQKALLIAIVLANTRLHIARRAAPPLLLFDEIVAHLDPDRRAVLLDRVLATGAQAWLTGTEPSLFEAIVGRAQFFTLQDGAIEPTPGVAGP